MKYNQCCLTWLAISVIEIAHSDGRINSIQLRDTPAFSFLPRCIECRRSSDGKAVRLYVCLCWIVTEKKLLPTLYIIWKNINLVFRNEVWLLRDNPLVGTTPSTWNFGSNWPRSSKNADFQSIFVRSASAVTPSETSSVYINRKSTMRSEPTINIVRCLYLTIHKKGSKHKTAVFRAEVHFSERMSATKFLCVTIFSDNVQ